MKEWNMELKTKIELIGKVVSKFENNLNTNLGVITGGYNGSDLLVNVLAFSQDQETFFNANKLQKGDYVKMELSLLAINKEYPITVNKFKLEGVVKLDQQVSGTTISEPQTIENVSVETPRESGKELPINEDIDWDVDWDIMG